MTSAITIGIDFDNTIVLYEDLFHRCALEEGLIRPETPKDKKVIRDEIRQLPQGEARWTTLQGLVYGWRMSEAKLAEGFTEFRSWARNKGYYTCIISHKTQYPALGEKIDLREAARQWMKQQGFFDPAGLALNPESEVFFEDTLANKLQRISEQKCDIFIDDLEEVLYHADFPKWVKRIHYTKASVGHPEIVVCTSWLDVVKWCESANLTNTNL